MLACSVDIRRWRVDAAAVWRDRYDDADNGATDLKKQIDNAPHQFQSVRDVRSLQCIDMNSFTTSFYPPSIRACVASPL